MENNKALAEVLNDLIRINEDRAKGYEKAAFELYAPDVDLKAVFQRMADQSRYFMEELSDAVRKLRSTPAADGTLQGKIYRAWMDVKSAFAGANRRSLLQSCEFGEDAAQRAYDDALASDADMNTATRQLIAIQKKGLKKSHDEIKQMRDMQLVNV